MTREPFGDPWGGPDARGFEPTVPPDLIAAETLRQFAETGEGHFLDNADADTLRDMVRLSVLAGRSRGELPWPTMDHHTYIPDEEEAGARGVGLPLESHTNATGKITDMNTHEEVVMAGTRHPGEIDGGRGVLPGSTRSASSEPLAPMQATTGRQIDKGTGLPLGGGNPPAMESPLGLVAEAARRLAFDRRFIDKRHEHVTFQVLYTPSGPRVEYMLGERDAGPEVPRYAVGAYDLYPFPDPADSVRGRESSPVGPPVASREGAGKSSAPAPG